MSDICVQGGVLGHGVEGVISDVNSRESEVEFFPETVIWVKFFRGQLDQFAVTTTNTRDKVVSK